ncbi:MAG TPA: GAF domain-containing protein [Anaerolineales bacterium]|nr:GAF domain-containing protein [Anaerolineales bacterium]
MLNEFTRLYEATRGLAAQRDWPGLLRVVVERAQNLLGTACAALYLYEAARQELELVAANGLALSPGQRLPWGKGLAGRAAQTRQPLVVSNYYTWEDRAPLYDGTLFTAVVGVPLSVGGELIGVLVAGETDTTSRQFGEADVRLLTLFAEQAANAVYNARLFNQLQRRLTDLEVTHKITSALRLARTPDEVFPLLLEETLAGLNAGAGSIWLYDPANDELVRLVAREFHTQFPMRLKPNVGVVGRVFVTNQPYVAREFKSDPYAHESVRAQMPAGWGGACVPLRAGQEVIGALFVTVALPRELKPDEVNLLITVAELAEAALTRAHESREPQWRLQRLAAQRTIDTAITTSLDLNVTLNIILDQVTTRLGVNAASVLLLNPESQMLEYAAGRGFHTDAITQSRLSLGEDYAAQAALKRRLMSLPDLSQASGDGFVRATLLADEGFVAYYSVPLIAKGRIKGVLEIFHRAPFNPDDEWLEFLSALAAQAAIAIDNALLFAGLQRSNEELASAYDTTLAGWSKALELRDQETKGHTERVTEMTLRLARAMGLSGEKLEHVRRGALLHDIGKMGIPDNILLKPGKLTDEEWEIMRQHPVYAYNLLLPIAYLRPALDIPYCHHEKWDGTGYPRGLPGEQIPLAARIFAVADVWDALCSDRPYRAAWPAEKVREHIRASAGTHFDPKVVEVFLKLP